MMNPNDLSEASRQKQATAATFHRASPTYDHVGPNFFSYFGRKLVEHAALPLNARVLDVATGRGAVLFPAGEAVGPQGSAIGIDLAEGMVQETAREVCQRGLLNVEVRQMDAEHLDFPDASFDAVLCGFAIFFFPQAAYALTEFERVLKPGGRLALTTWGDQFDKRWEWFRQLVETYLPPPPQGTEPSASADEPDFSTPAGSEKFIKEAGFTDIRVISETIDFAYATKEEWWESLWSHGSRATFERIEETCGAERFAQFKAECFAQMEAAQGVESFQRTFHALYSLAVKPVRLPRFCE
jgi:ubiquinone/menaquinone biosynthesis C-methylase UbiE